MKKPPRRFLDARGGFSLDGMNSALLGGKNHRKSGNGGAYLGFCVGGLAVGLAIKQKRCISAGENAKMARKSIIG
jgi:hypothetical protein